MTLDQQVVLKTSLPVCPQYDQIVGKQLKVPQK
jgi:hypothetical protein